MTLRLEWEPGEKPEFTFCESVHAPSRAPWHIRRVGPAGLKLGGGIDTPSLCGRVRPIGDNTPERRGAGGWDLRVRILPRHFDPPPRGERPICCADCANDYKKATGT